MTTTTGAPPAAADSHRTSAAPRVRLLGSGPQRWRWLGLGLAIMTAGALAGIIAVDRINERQPVLVAGDDLAAGHVLTAADLEVARISGTDGMSVVEEERLEETIGSALAVPVTKGSVLPESSLGQQSDYPGDGKAVVGAVLPPGRFPPSLQRGASVSVVVVDDTTAPAPDSEGGNGSAGATLPDSVTAYAARVDSVESTETEGAVSVELVVDAESAAQVSAATATERATVVQVQAGGES